MVARDPDSSNDTTEHCLDVVITDDEQEGDDTEESLDSIDMVVAVAKVENISGL